MFAFICSFAGLRITRYAAPAWAENASSLFNIIMGAVCPFVIIFASNLMIIFTLKRASSERVKLDANESRNLRQQKDTQHLTVMLILVSVAYIVTNLPYRMFDPIIEIKEIAAIYDMSKLYWKLRYSILAFSMGNLWVCNYAVNFYLYCIGGGSRYRNDTKDVIGWLCLCLNVKRNN
jgi:predicted ferric reductase